MTILFGGLDLGTPDGLINGHTKEKCLRWQYMREPERLRRVTFVRLQQRNASGIGERLVNLHHARRLAFEERMQRPYRPGDEFTQGDEVRAEQLLVELFPSGGA